MHHNANEQLSKTQGTRGVGFQGCFFQIFLWEARVILLGEKEACLGAFFRGISTHTETYTCKHKETHTLHCPSSIRSRPVEHYPSEHVGKE